MTTLVEEVEKLKSLIEGKDMEISTLKNLSEVDQERAAEVQEDRNKAVRELRCFVHLF